MNKNKILLSSTLLLLASACLFLKSKTKSPFNPQQYVIIGCSAAGFSAAQELSKHDPKNNVICLSEESAEPYKKTSIAKVVKGKKSFDAIRLGKNNIAFTMRLNAHVVSINALEKYVVLQDQTKLRYDKLLLAVGARPIIPKHLAEAISYPGVAFYNNKNDVDTILDRLNRRVHPHILIVGAGIRALELADSLTKRHHDVRITMLNRTARFLAENGDDGADRLIHKQLIHNNVELIAPGSIESITTKDDALVATLGNGQSLKPDAIVFALGTTPNSELARAINLKLYQDGSIKVNEELKTSHPDIFAAGDVVSFPNPIGQGSVKSAKWQSAKEQGVIAARNMTGRHETYNHKPAVFISSFFGYEALVSGNARTSSPNTSSIFADDNHYYRIALSNQRLSSFIFLWQKDQSSPNIFFIRKNLFDQNIVDERDFAITK